MDKFLILGAVMNVLAATGHRPQQLQNEWDGTGPLSLWIQGEMRKIVESEKPSAMISGMALGVDQIWAELAIIMNVPLIAAIPCTRQAAIWPESRRNKYNILLSKASEVFNVSGEDNYSRRFMLERNEWMVDHCDKLVAVWNGNQHGGTFHCITYAQHCDLPIVLISPQNFKG